MIIFCILRKFDGMKLFGSKIFKRETSIDDLYAFYKPDLYTSIHDMPFTNWIDLANGNLNAIKRCDYTILDGILSYARTVIYEEKAKIFGVSKEEISFFKRIADININKWKYITTGKAMYQHKASTAQARLDKDQDTGDLKLGDFSELIFKSTGKSYELNKMSAFEVLTIVNSIKNDNERRRKRNGNKQ